jgi:hypothetical protein
MQFYTLFMRAITNQLRSFQSGLFRLVPSIFTGIVFGLIFLNLPLNDQGVQSRAVRSSVRGAHVPYRRLRWSWCTCVLCGTETEGG